MPDSEKIQPFLPDWPYQVIRYATWLMTFLLLVILWPGNPLQIPGRAEFASAYAAALVALWLFLGLMQNIPETFESLWLRGAVDCPSGAAPKKPDSSAPAGPHPYEQLGPDYQAFVQELTRALNYKGQWWLAGFFVVLALGWYLLLWKAAILRTPILLVGAVVEPLIAFMLGLMAWRMVTIGWKISRLARIYRINLLVIHPDRCGGLAPIGNLCLLNALIIAVAGIHIGAWSLLEPGYRFGGLIVVPLGLSIFAFFIPMITVHTAMEKDKRAIQIQLDELSHRIHHEDRRLLEAGDYIPPARGEEWLAQVEMMYKLFDQHRSIPTWPVNWSIFGKFLIAEAVPVLSFVGLPKPILDIIQGLLPK